MNTFGSIAGKPSAGTGLPPGRESSCPSRLSIMTRNVVLYVREWGEDRIAPKLVAEQSCPIAQAGWCLSAVVNNNAVGATPRHTFPTSPRPCGRRMLLPRLDGVGIFSQAGSLIMSRETSKLQCSGTWCDLPFARSIRPERAISTQPAVRAWTSNTSAVSHAEDTFAVELCQVCGYPWFDCVCHPQWWAHTDFGRAGATPARSIKPTNLLGALRSKRGWAGGVIGHADSFPTEGATPSLSCVQRGGQS